MLGTRALILTIVGGAVTFITMGLLTILGPAPVVHATPGCPVGQVVGVDLLCEPIVATAPPPPQCSPGRMLSGLLCVDDPSARPVSPVASSRVTPVVARSHHFVAAPVVRRSPLVVPRRLAPVVITSVPVPVRVVPPMVATAPPVMVAPVIEPAPVVEPVVAVTPVSGVSTSKPSASSACPTQRPRPVVGIEVEVVQS
jgi:hypothetical protein